MPRALAILLLLVGFAVSATAQPAGEVVRVRAHLVAARAVVEARDISELAPVQRARRTEALAVLDRYIERGVYPIRAGDSYGALQPRFIDARGVHCAVGEMIAQTGHEDLARAINRDFEYAKVADIHSSALLAWAEDYGFTVDELARIQPSYSEPPTEDGVRQRIEQQRDTAMLACASAPPPPRVSIRMISSREGAVTIEAPDGATPFEQCFAGSIKAPSYGGAMAPSPEAFDHTISVSLRTPKQVLDARLVHDVGFAPQCSPRPGALARTATLSVKNSVEDGLAIVVTTKPPNADIARCIRDHLAPALADFRSVAELSYTRTWDLAHMTAQSVKAAVERVAPGFATDCYERETAPTNVSLAISAKPDDAAFTISGGGNASYMKCVTDKLGPALRARFVIAHDGTSTFRIDNSVDVHVSFPVELPADRTARLAREQKERKKRDAALLKLRDEEMRRQDYR